MIINSKRKDRQGVMEMNPQGFNDNMSAAFDDFLNYHNFDKMRNHKQLLMKSKIFLKDSPICTLTRMIVEDFDF